MENHSPLIVTLMLDDASFSFFDALRKKYFPPARNFLAAHLTLFHHLPSTEASIKKDLEEWSHEYTPLTLQVTEVKSMGKGVAYKIECPALLQLHKKMQAKWEAWLTPQDNQKIWPHITVQNKVSVTESQETLKTLQRLFQPFTAQGLGFSVWVYENGPWRLMKHYPFKQD